MRNDNIMYIITYLLEARTYLVVKCNLNITLLCVVITEQALKYDILSKPVKLFVIFI